MTGQKSSTATRTPSSHPQTASWSRPATDIVIITYRRLVLSEDLSDETTMTTPPLPVQRLLWATAGRVARITGYSGIDGACLDDEFWRSHVEQLGGGGV